MSNTLGKTDFWMGVVENRTDPLGVGRCQIRVFGFHTDNLNELPTSDLPWALPALPTNASKSFSAPRNGDYVIGFFGDGQSGQVPIYTGVLPGIISQSPDTSKGFSPQGKQTNPQLPAGQSDQAVGQPTTVPLARGIVANTAIAVADANRAHVCSFTGKMDLEMSTLKADISKLINDLRIYISGLFESGKNSLISEELKQKIAALQAQIKLIQGKVQAELKKLEALKAYYDELQQLIALIQSLPAEAQRLVAQCLTDAQTGLAGAISDIKKQTGIDDLNQAISEINTQVSTGAQALTQATQQVQDLAQQVQQAQKPVINIDPMLP